MAEADRAKAEKTLRDQQREFSRKAGEFQDDASTRRNEEIGKVQRYLVSEIQAYSNSQGFDLVVAEAIFAKSALDITPQVLAVLATKPTTLPTAPAAAPAASGTAPSGKAPTAPAKPSGK
jgi:outer membrane protein